MAGTLKNQAILSLIENSFLIAEGSPTDSLSLTQAFHSHGVNMRYLGLVYERFVEITSERNLKFKHIEFLLEKEIFARCIKH